MSAEHLTFSLTWMEAPERLASAALQVRLDADVIWPTNGAHNAKIEIQADDLLSYLTEFWKPLSLRQTYPIAVKPERPSQLRSASESRWESLPSELVEREDEIVIAFEDAHDMSRCFAGFFGLHPLWFMRAGGRMLIETQGVLRSVDLEAAREAMSAAGDAIACRLGRAADDKWINLIEAWRMRDTGEPVVLLAWSSSLDRELAQRFVTDGTLKAPMTVTEAANDNDELRMAARMSSALPPDQIRSIIGLVKTFPSTAACRLDELAKATQMYVCESFARHRAHEQGEAAAAFVREKLRLPEAGFIDVFAVLKDLGVDVHFKSVDPGTLDGLAVWGNCHGPAVLLNEKSRRFGTSNDRTRNAPARVTMAHELCHLLIDRGHALSAIDVLNSQMPLEFERRAKAFAGELLLPGRIAADAWIREGRPESMSGLKTFVSHLGFKYRVPKPVAAWKLEHGLYRLNIDLRDALNLAVPLR